MKTARYFGKQDAVTTSSIQHVLHRWEMAQVHMKAKLLCSYHLVLCRLENINLHLVQCFDHINHEHIQQFPPTHATESSDTSHALQRQDLLQSFRGIRKLPSYVRLTVFLLSQRKGK